MLNMNTVLHWYIDKGADEIEFIKSKSCASESCFWAPEDDCPEVHQQREQLNNLASECQEVTIFDFTEAENNRNDPGSNLGGADSVEVCITLK